MVFETFLIFSVVYGKLALIHLINSAKSKFSCFTSQPMPPGSTSLSLEINPFICVLFYLSLNSKTFKRRSVNWSHNYANLKP